MLNNLFESELRVKLINLFFLHPEGKYCATQIATDLNTNLNSTRKEIDNLLQAGLIIETEAPIKIEVITENAEDEKKITKKKVKTKKIKEKKEEIPKYFEANKKFILYPEIRALFIKAQILSSQNFITSLEKSFQAKLLILTGFFTNQTDAQTDLLIVGQIKRQNFFKLISDLEKDLGHEINFTILDETEFYYRKEIMDIFLHTILDGKNIILIDNLSNK